jgi:antitoxin component YwqK of YwqJK toxin-antitoxin module
MGFVLSNAHIVKSDQVEIKSKRVVTHIEEQADATETWPARKIKGTLVDGQPDGDINSYSFDGKLMITEPQRMGKRHGVRVAYFPNGKVFSEEDFVNDMLHGESKQYYPNGKLRSVITFVRNKPHGEHIIYFENGNPIVKSFLILGKAQGKRFHYLKDGTHWGTTLWQDDQQVDQKVLVNPTDSDIQEMEQYANYPTALKSYWQDESETPIPARVK